jgi:hypothetical protein
MGTWTKGFFQDYQNSLVRIVAIDSKPHSEFASGDSSEPYGQKGGE